MLIQHSVDEREKKTRITEIKRSIKEPISDLIDMFSELGSLHMELIHHDEALDNYRLCEALSNYLSKRIPEKEATGKRERLATLASFQNNIGICLLKESRIEKALLSFNKAKEIRERIKDLDGESRSLHYLSICHEAQNEHEKSEKCLNKIQKIRDNQPDFSGTLEEEKEEKDKELQERQKQHDLHGIAGIKCDLGMICERMRDLLPDIPSNKKKIIKLNQQAIRYYREALETNTLPEPCIALIHGRVGEIFWHEENFSEAKKFIESSLIKSKELERGNYDQLYVTAHHCTILKYYPEGRGSVKAFIEHANKALAKICLIEGDEEKASDYLQDNKNREYT